MTSRSIPREWGSTETHGSINRTRLWDRKLYKQLKRSVAILCCEKTRSHEDVIGNLCVPVPFALSTGNLHGSFSQLLSPAALLFPHELGWIDVKRSPGWNG